MWKCHKCGKPVYFAERKQSLGYDWHPECLRCEECGKRLNPGQHAEHKGVPYCHVPCYGALFGPQLFGHGTRVESHTSFGKVENKTCGSNMPRSHLESKLNVYNQYYDGRSGEIRSREVNGRLVLEGALRIHWAVTGVIHLKEDDDQRVVVTIRKRNSMRSDSYVNGNDLSDSDTGNGDSVESINSLAIDNSSSCSTTPATMTTDSIPSDNTLSQTSRTNQSNALTDNSDDKTLVEDGNKYMTLPSRLEDVEKSTWDEFDDLLMVEKPKEDGEKLYQTMPTSLPSSTLSLLSSSTTQSDQELSTTSTDIQDSPSYKPIRNAPIDTATYTIRNNRMSPTKTSNTLVDSSLSLDNNDTLNDSSDIEQDSYSLHFEDRIEDERPLDRSMSNPEDITVGKLRDENGDIGDDDDHDEEKLVSEGPVDVRRRKGSTAIKRRPGRRRSRNNIKLKRRCSINGHFYNRETSFFTPPHGSQMSVWVTSLVSTPEVINLVLDKYKVESKPHNFALFVVRDNGEQRRLRDDEYPLLVRVMLGPHEDVAKLYIMDRYSTDEISNDVAQFLNLSLAECRAIVDRFNKEEEREVKRIRAKYLETSRRIRQRMDEMRVRL